MTEMQLSTQIAEVYDEFFVPALFAEWPPRILAAAALQAGQRVLDVACGTGVLTCAAAERVGAQGSVTGLDLNAGMLAVAKRKSSVIDWREGRAEDLPFRDDSFDAVVSQFGLMFFHDRPTALREMLRVLRPSGYLSIAVWGALTATPGYAAVATLLYRLFGAHAADGLSAPFSLGDIQALNRVLTEAGLPNARVVTHSGTARFPSIRSWMYTEIKGWVLADMLDDSQFEQLVAVAEQELQQFVIADGSVAFQTPAHIITATKLQGKIDNPEDRMR